MDFSSNNTVLWNIIIQMSFICGVLVLGNILRQKVSVVKKANMPVAVIGGFIILFLRMFKIIAIDTKFLEMLTYHGIALGFIALTLRTSEEKNLTDNVDFVGIKSGAVIVSTYLIQSLIGLAISLGLYFTVMKNLFPASGILLPMGYGQGPGQANNIGSTYEALGFKGGRSYALSIAAMGYFCACIIGVVYLNYLSRKGEIKKTEYENISGSITVDMFQNENEIPISESVDKLSIQIALIILVYGVSYLFMKFLVWIIGKIVPSAVNMVSPLIWGFNFVIGSIVAILFKTCFKKLKKHGIMKKQYQNNYLLNRISGLAFDVMIIAGIGSINIEDISGLWFPFIITCVLGGVVTFFYLKWLTAKVYKDYKNEAMLSMFGMLTGTISSGVLLLREVDPHFKTPAGNNLVLGTSYGIILGFPLLILIGLAPKSIKMLLVVFGIIVVYLVMLFILMFKLKKKQS